MPLSKQDQRASYPLAAYNFRVTVDGTAMRFAKVSGLAREHQTVTYRHGLSFIEGEQIAKYYIDKYVSVTLEQGTVIGSKFLHEWLERKTKCAMEVSLCDQAGLPVIAWRIAKALPVKLSAPSLDARTSEVAIDSLEIKAAGISIVHLS
ncbi:MAG TPA: phage tail protein [Haliangium sp.]|nr:phage tail protein [Haliangium sp.]